ncbi:MAG: hypothetical protein Q8R63_03535, partial [Ramlibacter sp.]|nr:hypothetical protein [Ramlibacter sp.]
MAVFNPVEFVARIGKRLVAEFDDASQGGTPTLVGDARELPARTQLERLLPNFVAIGSGLVFDASGKVSRQQDIVLYDRSFCPRFSVNDVPSATYYPIEAVIAVGEVKSSLDKKTLEDGFEKIESVKSLTRVARQSPNLSGQRSVPFRSYGARQALQGTLEESFDQLGKPTDQVFGFILCGKFDRTLETT